MITRLNYFTTAPQAMDILLNQENYLNQAFEDNKLLIELVKIRVSQINQCAFCIDMHSKDALKHGEQIERIYGLNAWRDMTCYSEKEQHALQWAELIISEQTAADIEYQLAVQALGEKTLVDLTVLLLTPLTVGIVLPKHLNLRLAASIIVKKILKESA